MFGIPLVLAEYVRDRYGVVSVAELDELGLSARRRQRMVEAGLLRPCHAGVYRVASAPPTFEARCRAACLARPDAVVTGRTAGRLLGLRRMGSSDEIEVRVPHFVQAFEDETVVQRRCSLLLADHVVVRDDGIRVVTPARLAFDLAAVLSRADLESVVEQMLDLGLCTLADLGAMCRLMAARGRPGSRRFRELLESRDPDVVAVDSHLELRLERALRAAGVRGIRRQLEIRRPDRSIARFDLAVPELRWAIEVDHATWHAGRADAERDKRRDRQTASMGWATSRVTEGDVIERLADTVRELLAIHRRLAHPRPA